MKKELYYCDACKKESAREGREVLPPLEIKIIDGEEGLNFTYLQHCCEDCKNQLIGVMMAAYGERLEKLRIGGDK